MVGKALDGELEKITIASGKLHGLYEKNKVNSVVESEN